MITSVIYVASPYTGSVQERNQRFREVRAYTAKLLEQGKTAISPIVHNHSLTALYNLPTDFAFWQNFCLNLLTVCDQMHVLTLKGWEESAGLQAEIVEAGKMEIPIVYIDPKTYERIKR